MIAILYAKAGGEAASLGHAVLARNYENLLRQNGLECVSIDLMESAGGLSIDFGRTFYARMLYSFPGTWRWIQGNWHLIPGVGWFRNSILPSRFLATRRLLNQMQPALVLTTHPFATALASSMKRRGQLQAPLIATIADWGYQPFCWFPEVDHYLAPSERHRVAMIASGVPATGVSVSGPLVAPEFYARISQRDARQRLGLPSEKTIVLVMSGAWAFRLEEMILPLLASKEICLVVLIGSQNSEPLKASVERAGGHVIHFLHDPSLYFHASDLIITKPGGMTPAESLATGLPMLLVNPLPGHEENNLRQLVADGLACAVEKGETLLDAVHRVLRLPRPERPAVNGTESHVLAEIRNYLKVSVS